MLDSEEPERQKAKERAEEITCRIAPWYYRRMAMIVGLLVLGGLWFFYDGKVAWPKKNVVALAQAAFEAGKAETTWEDFAAAEEGSYHDAQLDDEASIALIKEAHAEGAKPMPWEEFAMSTEGKDALSKGGDAAAKAAFGAGIDPTMDWAQYAAANELPVDVTAARAVEGGVDRYEALHGAFNAARGKRKWGLFGESTGRSKWGEDVAYHSRSEISGQFAFAYALWVVAGVLFVWALINSRRVLKAGAESFVTETGTEVRFADVVRIDKRKWDNKGLGFAFYRTADGGEKRAVLDDLKYVGTAKILDRIMDGCSKECVMIVREEDTDTADEDV